MTLPKSNLNKWPQPELEDDEDGNDKDDDFGDEDYSSEKSDVDSSRDDDYEPPSKKTRPSNKFKEDKPLNKDNYSKRIRWTKYKKDPETGKLICVWRDCDKKLACSAAFKAYVDEHNGTPPQRCDQCDENTRELSWSSIKN